MVVVQQIVGMVEIKMVEAMVGIGNATTRQNIVGRMEHAPTTVVPVTTKGRDTMMMQPLPTKWVEAPVFATLRSDRTWESGLI